MPNYNNILKTAVEEDARAGKSKVRVLSIPKKAKRKDGDDIHKLPAAFPVINEYEKEFKRDYSETLNKFFMPALKELLK